MTVNEVIARVDKHCPNQISRAEKVGFITACERRIINEALSNYPEASYDRGFKKYDPDTDGERELFAACPYDELYVHYVMAEIYLILHEQNHYNNELYIFNSILGDYKVHLIKRMKPVGPSRFRVR